MTEDSKLSRRSFLSGAAALGAFAAAGLAGCAKEEAPQASATEPAADPAPTAQPAAQAQSTKDVVYEVNVTPNPNWHFGSTGVEANPTNLDNLVFVCTATQPWDNRWHFSMGQAVYYSMDGGDWKEEIDRDYKTRKKR